MDKIKIRYVKLFLLAEAFRDARPHQLKPEIIGQLSKPAVVNKLGKQIFQLLEDLNDSEERLKKLEKTQKSKPL